MQPISLAKRRSVLLTGGHEKQPHLKKKKIKDHRDLQNLTECGQLFDSTWSCALMLLKTLPVS